MKYISHLIKNHTMMVVAMVGAMIGSLMQVSSVQMAAWITSCVVLAFYDKLHDILLVLRAQPQISNCVINAETMTYSPHHALNLPSSGISQTEGQTPNEDAK